jgi:hypothetical protein
LENHDLVGLFNASKWRFNNFKEIQLNTATNAYFAGIYACPKDLVKERQKPGSWLKEDDVDGKHPMPLMTMAYHVVKRRHSRYQVPTARRIAYILVRVMTR